MAPDATRGVKVLSGLSVGVSDLPHLFSVVFCQRFCFCFCPPPSRVLACPSGYPACAHPITEARHRPPYIARWLIRPVDRPWRSRCGFGFVHTMPLALVLSDAVRARSFPALPCNARWDDGGRAVRCSGCPLAPSFFMSFPSSLCWVRLPAVGVVMFFFLRVSVSAALLLMRNTSGRTRHLISRP